MFIRWCLLQLSESKSSVLYWTYARHKTLSMWNFLESWSYMQLCNMHHVSSPSLLLSHSTCVWNTGDTRDMWSVCKMKQDQCTKYVCNKLVYTHYNFGPLPRSRSGNRYNYIGHMRLLHKVSRSNSSADYLLSCRTQYIIIVYAPKKLLHVSWLHSLRWTSYEQT